MSAGTPRIPLIDAIKAIAAQAIVLHHLAFYGPMSDTAYDLAPTLIDWFDLYGRYAVQAFLAVGGFLAARALAPAGISRISGLLPLLGQRYLRLALPYIAALALAVVLSAGARLLMQHESISAPPAPAQVAAHLLLLHDILGYEALSAGVWYVAIDFQLFALMALLLWTAQRIGAGRLAPAAVALLALASLFHFNRIETWDDWGFYFFGAYAMGALAYWGSTAGRARLWLILMATIGIAALAIDFRWRIAVALATALALAFARKASGRESPVPAYLGKISYSVFLVHFPVCLVVNAVFFRLFPSDPLANAAGIAIAWASSIAAGALFHRHVETGAARNAWPFLQGAIMAAVRVLSSGRLAKWMPKSIVKAGMRG